ncbi:hypothetical protein [Micromonospora sp. DT229]|uniref:hypothetical protein n=1 Tax=Micromonospora sp. DT229 TaxID=3393430 RepID=UPI003CF67D9F
MVAGTGDADRTRRLTDDAEIIARSITDPWKQARALVGLASPSPPILGGSLRNRFLD